MLGYILTISGILLSSIASYFSSKVMIKHIYSYAESFYKRPINFIMFYTGLIISLTVYISSINLTVLNKPLLGYYILLFNVVLDLSIVFGILILFKKIRKFEISKDFIFALSVVFTLHLFLILKKSLNLIDSIILFITFIAVSIFLINKEKEEKSLKIKKMSTKDFLTMLPIFILSLSIIYASSILISMFAINLNNLLGSTPLSAYIVNLISTMSQNVIVSMVILEERNKTEESLLPIIGEAIYTFTIYIGTICGISPILFSVEMLLPTISAIFLVYISLVFLNLLNYDILPPREVGLLIIILCIILGLLTMV